MIELKDVTKVFNSGRPNEFAALRGITMSIEPLKVTAIEGPSGSGKTSLLSIVGCMSRPTSGRVWLDGREITSLPERFLTGIRRKTFGFVFQQFHLIPYLTAYENVMLPLVIAGEARSEIRKRAMGILELLDVESKAESKVQWLSGGEAQRVAIARA
ncbi:MAG: ATP-binding cassette domain-containing protein, partial [Thermodesulfovibrionales bacterium]|nr:ATP-binding cassette domain-containing protein [Thermodesulfovibrionales bacterium]